MSADGRVYRFGPFEADSRSGELRKHGIGIRLREQPFRILLLLLERPGEVVLREEIRARLWPGGVVVDFDHGINTAVQRLRDALSETAAQPRYVETVGRRGYRFIAPLDGSPQPIAPTTAAGWRYRKLVWAVLASLATAAAGAGLWMARNRGASPPPRLVRLTAFTGTETMPTFSPDGKQVAFVWDGENKDNRDLYVKMAGSPTLLRLTSDPADDEFPAWSPDGRQIAFISTRGQTGIYLVSPLGGPERKLADLPANTRPSWSADGKFLAVARSYSEPPAPGGGAVFLVPVEGGGQPRAILVPPPGMWYRHPAFSPDSRSLAVTVCRSTIDYLAYPQCQLQIVSLNRELLPQGAPRTVVSEWAPFMGLAWAPDGGSLVVSGFLRPAVRLWRVSAVRPAEPERIELAGVPAVWPAVSPTGGRLAFCRSTGHSDIWRWQRGGKLSPFLTSTVRNLSPQFSPDGRRIAFQSGRSGEEIGVWVADADGTGLVQITQGLTLLSGSPRWSPDGQWIAFDAQGKNGLWDVWKLEAGGGPPRQLTAGPGNNGMPSWSGDGKRVYFSSSRSGPYEIWCVPAEGGTPRQITHRGGHVGFKSADGKTLYYTKSESGAEGIYALPLGGGEEKQVIADQVALRGFAVFANGIYYLTARGKNLYEIRFHEFASGRNRPIREIEGPLSLGFAVSPDQNTFLFSKAATGADLMLIENFR